MTKKIRIPKRFINLSSEEFLNELIATASCSQSNTKGGKDTFKYKDIVDDVNDDIINDVIEFIDSILPDYNKIYKSIFSSLFVYNTMLYNLPDIKSRYTRLCIIGNVRTQESMILKYGEKLGTEKFDIYRKKQAYTNTFEYKANTYNMSEAEFKVYNKSRAITLNGMILKYGEKLGTEKFDIYRKKQAYTNTLPYFKEKYGEKLGKEKYTTICKHKAITLENMQRVHGNDIGTEKYKSFLKKSAEAKIRNNIGYSNISIELFDAIRNNLPSDIVCRYATFGEEFYILHDNKLKLYDFVIEDLNICIEFNGDYWHAEPSKYKSGHIFKRGNTTITSDEIWKNDSKKLNIIENIGYSTHVVWETDYLYNKKLTIDTLCSIIMQTYNDKDKV